MAAGVSLPVLLLMVSTVVECASGVGGLQLTPLGPGWRFQASSHSPSSLKPPIVRAAFGGAWDEELRVAAELALEAGAAISAAIAERDKIMELKDEASVDPVTATDKANEQLIADGLRRAFPSHAVLGEEEASSGGGEGDGHDRKRVPAEGPCWCIDPVDGTTNFVHGLGLVCVSIGLCVDGEPVAAVVFNPISKDLFFAQKGRGAFLNGRRLPSLSGRPPVPLRSALVVQEMGYARDAAAVRAIHAAGEAVVAAGVRGVRQLGSGVLDLCFVACGRADACFAGVAGEGWWPWDHCAGSLLVTEAGGVLRTIEEGGGIFTVNSRSILCASSEELADELAAAIASSRS